MAVPTCKKCGAQHYNMQPCNDAAEHARVQRNLAQPRLRPRVNDWANDRLTTLVRVSDNVTAQRRPAAVGRTTAADRLARIAEAATAVAVSDA